MVSNYFGPNVAIARDQCMRYFAERPRLPPNGLIPPLTRVQLMPSTCTVITGESGAGKTDEAARCRTRRRTWLS